MFNYQDLGAFIWSLGPAAIGLIFVWVAEWRLKRAPQTEDKRIAIVSLGAYVVCWTAALVCFSLFVMLWVRPYFSSTSYVSGVIENLPRDYKTAFPNASNDQIIYFSDRTIQDQKLLTLGWIVHQRIELNARQHLNQIFTGVGNVLKETSTILTDAETVGSVLSTIADLL